MDNSFRLQTSSSPPQGESNHVPLSPISFLERAVRIHPERVAVIDEEVTLTYRAFYQRCCRLTGALQALGIASGEVVSTLGMNSRATLEAHYGVPMAGGVLNAINARLDGASIAFIMAHAETRILIFDRSLRSTVAAALSQLTSPAPLLIEIEDGSGEASLQALPASHDYEALLAGATSWVSKLPGNEHDCIALNYTSGTTGNPKGVIYSHRGAYLNALSNTLTLKMDDRTVYLWTLPMFHCNGWTHTWAVTAAGGTHVCMRRVEPARVLDMIHTRGITHMAAAPIIMTMLLDQPEAATPLPHAVTLATGGAPPNSATIARMSALGFDVLHLYGMTETYGPSLVCQFQPEWAAMTHEARARLQIRQGVGTFSIERVALKDPVTHEDVPADGRSLGHLMLRGNTIMQGYNKNPDATREAMGRGWLDTGDIAVMHEDGYIEIRDRAKDIIISGGESISSIEIEEIMMNHPAIREVAVIARPHEFWGETPHAFVVLVTGADALDETELLSWCRAHMAHFKVPRHVTFQTSLPRTSTGKLQKYALREHQKTQMATA
ncbi:fatty-acyl-CoA synthase [Kushneria avicenniae]|uniref:Fatty-acyl-CoA synthase n=1 Tax=Kushneria avicenniae TaxID=402385 RepID=A0A1I1KG09_9GAMM|nr:AMP-binding protein [Kushneria avicenniae]SFC59759.1 fatty-acyl-CoA synthase [Kushneria avicenniae]